MTTEQAKQFNLQRRCDQWNADNPVGTAVRYHPIIGEKEYRETKTRSSAVVLSDHTPVVWVDGMAGCVVLDALEVTQ